jgi:hypothetical protein
MNDGKTKTPNATTAPGVNKENPCTGSGELSFELPGYVDAGFQFVTQSDLQRIAGLKDKKNFRNRLRALRIWPDKRFAQTALYRLERIPEILAALGRRPAPRRYPKFTGIVHFGNQAYMEYTYE